MGRWRPPTKPSSPYITPEGAQALKDELQDLWKVQRPEVVRALSAAAAEGDRSENAEYIYRKKQLGAIDRRVRYLGKRIPQLRVVDRIPDDPTSIRFGACIRLGEGEGEPREVRIVGADEIDADRGWISIDSPVARALLGKHAGDQVSVELPAGDTTLDVLAVWYPEPV